MKMKIAAGSVAIAVVAAGLLWASPASATGDYNPPPPEACTPSAAIPGWTEDVPDIEHPAVEAIPAVYEVEYKFVHKFDHLHLFPKWKTDPNWNAEENDHSKGWINTGETRQGALITPEVPGVDAYTEVTPDIEHPEIPAVTCETTAPAPTWTDDCGVDNGYWSYTDTEAYHYETTVVGDGTVEIWVEANEGYVLAEGPSWWSESDTDELCPTPRAVTGTPTVFDACGTELDRADFPTEFAGGSFKIGSITDMGDGTTRYRVVFTPNPGFLLPETGSWDRIVDGKAVWFLYADNVTACPTEEEPVVTTLAIPTWTDVCGTEDDGANLPASTEGVEYSWNSDDPADYYDVRATVEDGYIVDAVPAGWESVGEGVYVYNIEMTDEACDNATTPIVPASNTTNTGALAATGGSDVNPIVPIGAASLVILGALAVYFTTFRRRVTQD